MDSWNEARAAACRQGFDCIHPPQGARQFRVKGSPFFGLAIVDRALGLVTVARIYQAAIVRQLQRTLEENL